jgi:hypothetical protein
VQHLCGSDDHGSRGLCRGGEGRVGAHHASGRGWGVVARRAEHVGAAQAALVDIGDHLAECLQRYHIANITEIPTHVREQKTYSASHHPVTWQIIQTKLEVRRMMTPAAMALMVA